MSKSKKLKLGDSVTFTTHYNMKPKHGVITEIENRSSYRIGLIREGYMQTSWVRLSDSFSGNRIELDPNKTITIFKLGPQKAIVIKGSPYFYVGCSKFKRSLVLQFQRFLTKNK